MWMSLDFTDDQSTLVQVMAWCHQATSHYLNHCWPRSPTPYVITRPQWVKWSYCKPLLVMTIIRMFMSMTIHFYPRPVLAFGYCRCLHLCVCVCVCLSVNHLLICAITWDPFKLGSPNLDQRCKRPWLRSLLFFGLIDLALQGQI